MRLCSRCTFPRKFTRVFEWHPDGTIMSAPRTRTSAPITFLEAREFDALFDTLSDKIGVSTDRFLVQAQKNIGKVMLGNLPIKHIRRIPARLRLEPLARALVRLIGQDIAALGDGRLALERYRAGKVLVLRFRNSCANPLLVGSSAGIYESIEEMPGAHVQYHLEGTDLVVTLTHADSAPPADHQVCAITITGHPFSR